MGRPSKLTPITQARFLEAIELGATYEMACRHAGFGPDALARYRGNAGFEESLKKAEASAVVRCLTVIAEAAPKNWQAAAWLLERRYPQDYARRAPDATETGYDEPTLRQLALERGLDPDEFVATVARVQQAQAAARQAGATLGPRPGRL